MRQKAEDFWFALRSDRGTLACYRDIRDNRKFFEIYREVEQERGER